MARSQKFSQSKRVPAQTRCTRDRYTRGTLRESTLAYLHPRMIHTHRLNSDLENLTNIAPLAFYPCYFSDNRERQARSVRGKPTGSAVAGGIRMSHRDNGRVVSAVAEERVGRFGPWKDERGNRCPSLVPEYLCRGAVGMSDRLSTGPPSCVQPHEVRVGPRMCFDVFRRKCLSERVVRRNELGIRYAMRPLRAPCVVTNHTDRCCACSCRRIVPPCPRTRWSRSSSGRSARIEAERRLVPCARYPLVPPQRRRSTQHVKSILHS